MPCVLLGRSCYHSPHIHHCITREAANPTWRTRAGMIKQNPLLASQVLEKILPAEQLEYSKYQVFTLDLCLQHKRHLVASASQAQGQAWSYRTGAPAASCSLTALQSCSTEPFSPSRGFTAWLLPEWLWAAARQRRHLAKQPDCIKKVKWKMESISKG